MSPVLQAMVVYGYFVAFVVALLWKPRLIGTAAFVVFALTGCVEAGQGRATNAATAFFLGILYGVLPFAFWRPKEKSTP